jgi:fructokinase
VPGPPAHFLVIGESLVDLVAVPWAGSTVDGQAFTAHTGGSPLNVAAGLARLGQSATFVTEYGPDALGRLIEDTLRGAVEAGGALDVRAVDRPTNLAIVTTGPTGSPSYDFRLGWSLGPADVEIPAETTCLHTGSLAVALEPGRWAVLAAVRAAHEAGVAVSLDPNIRPSLCGDRATARALIEELVDHATIVKASVEDIAWLYPDEDPRERMGRWATRARLVVLTTGADGCVGWSGPDRVELPAVPVTVVDTIGAGDSFTAALLAHLAETGTLATTGVLGPGRLRAALTFAGRAAAFTCARAGARGPSRAELDLTP